MIKNYLADQVKILSAEFDSDCMDLNPIVASTGIGDRSFLATKILYATAYYGKIFPKTSLLKTAMSLEFLGLATKMGKIAQESDEFSDRLLLATDYLYAKAIDQVITLGDPLIIKILAKAIADTASDRTRSDIEPPHLEHLVLAAYDLGKYISDGDSGPAINEILKIFDLNTRITKKNTLSLFR